MLEVPRRSNRPQWEQLHPFIWKTLFASMLWILAAYWIFFGHDTYTALQVAVSTGFGVVFAVTPLFLWQVNGKKGVVRGISFKDWANGDLQTHTGCTPAGSAAVMILLVPVAIAAGTTAIGFIAFSAAQGWL